MPPVWLPGGPAAKAPAHDPGPSLSHSHHHDGGWTSTPPPRWRPPRDGHSAQQTRHRARQPRRSRRRRTDRERALEIHPSHPSAPTTPRWPPSATNDHVPGWTSLHSAARGSPGRTRGPRGAARRTACRSRRASSSPRPATLAAQANPGRVVEEPECLRHCGSWTCWSSGSGWVFWRRRMLAAAPHALRSSAGLIGSLSQRGLANARRR
jgi:hypothetical protein